PNAGDGRTSPLKSPFVRGFSMSAQEKEDMLAALRSLTDTRFVTNPRHSDPFLPPACSADCDLDQEASMEDVRDALAVAFETASLARCVPGDTSGDGAITVDELVAAVAGLHGGCE
ncbi:MAG: hypothetical protein SF182_08705, partial [Deltaproteobacteria bacterium]|nr:hypothetical protein [Deltaproteobacteria bacterium]